MLLFISYPKAMTPGCTVQACGIRDYKAEFKKVKTEVLAISPDEVKRLEKFEEKQELNFNLLSDPEHKVTEKYGAWGLKKFMGMSTWEFFEQLLSSTKKVVLLEN